MALTAHPRKVEPIGQHASVLDHSAMLELWLAEQVKRGKITFQNAKRYWQRHKDDLIKMAHDKLPMLRDLASGGKAIFNIVRDLGIAGRYYIKRYANKEYIIFKGSAVGRR